ncbi:MAG: carbohydrate ABC transporter permease [Phycisphaerales bacterium]|nr:carbohydrate ABC transporter permease [Phycisphaerales bacterium]
MALVGVLYALPLLWMFSTSLKPVEQVLADPPTLLPEPLGSVPRYAAENYIGRVGPDGVGDPRGVWTDPVVDFPLFLRNSLVVAILSVSGMVISSAIVAYGFARVRWRGRGAVFALVLATMMIPFPVLMGPMYVLFKEFGWIGTLRPLWVPAWFAGAFNVFLLRQFYLTIPRELDEAAYIDGCSHWGVFTRIILPLSRPALAVVALFHFIAVWNDFLGPLIFLQKQEHFTLALGLALYQSQAGNVPWNLLMAASTLVLAPVLILFVFAQRTFVEGIATQGLKE